eukprot:1137983-Pelagomonas_calceolata.AAC.2
MALDMLAGNLGSKEEQHLASRVVRLVVAGGCIGEADDDDDKGDAIGTGKGVKWILESHGLASLEQLTLNAHAAEDAKNMLAALASLCIP